jgi:hypothetical protein
MTSHRHLRVAGSRIAAIMLMAAALLLPPLP